MTDEPKEMTPRVRQRVTRAAREGAEDMVQKGKVLKVLYLDEKGEPAGEWASGAMPENSFDGLTMKGVQEPPFRLEQLVYLAELHPVHSAALEQKTADVLGKGWQWTAADDDEGDPDQRELLSEWFEALAPDDMDMKELLQAVWLDFETTGWGLIELVRGPDGAVRRAYHVPAHTVRAHRDGYRLVQIRDNKEAWFRRWNSPPLASGRKVKVDAKTGSRSKVSTEANDMLVLKRPSRRSTWYGIPGYISAVGWITLALAARDDNLMFFQNRREPRWAIVLTNLAEGDDVEEMLRRAFTVDLKQPHRNIIVPIEGPGKVEFQKLADQRQEGSFDRLSERADRAIMIGHRTPAERIANAEIGPLGGNATREASRIYKEGVVGPGQEFLAGRLNRLVEIEWPIASGVPAENIQWKIVMDDLDLGTDAEELQQAADEFRANMCTLREARAKVKRGPLMAKTEDGEEEESPYNDMLWCELPGTSPHDDPAAAPGTIRRQEDAADAADALEKQVAQLIDSGREVERVLADLAARA